MKKRIRNNFVKLKINAFTVAEIMCVLVILGIVAVITIPSTVKNTRDTVNRIKMKKAVFTYTAVVERMSAEHHLLRTTEALDDWANETDTNCANARLYFKIVKTNPKNQCQFMTADKMWWDVSKMSKTIVAFKEKNLTKEKAMEYTFDAFFLMTQFDENGAIRPLDVAYGNKEGYSVNILNNAKVYAYINKNNIYDYYNFCSNDSKTSCIHKQCPVNEDCRMDFYGKKDGEPIGFLNNCNNNGIYCKSSQTPWEKHNLPKTDYGEETWLSDSIACDTQGDNCRYAGTTWIKIEDTQPNIIGTNSIDLNTITFNNNSLRATTYSTDYRTGCKLSNHYDCAQKTNIISYDLNDDNGSFIQIQYKKDENTGAITIENVGYSTKQNNGSAIRVYNCKPNDTNNDSRCGSLNINGVTF